MTNETEHDTWETSTLCNEHNPQWTVCHEGGGDMIADLSHLGKDGEYYANRIVACVNACAGFETHELEETAEGRNLRHALDSTHGG